MKRIFIMLIVAMLSFSVDAQNLSTKEVSEAYAEAMKSDVTMFLGIPVDGTVSSMKQKLIAKGFKQDSNMLSGQFNGQDVYLSIVANKGKVWRVAVINKTPYSEEQIRTQFNYLVGQFKLSFLKECPNASLKDIETACKVMLDILKLTGQLSKPVWFQIDKDYYKGYRIFIFYDNVYNKPNGEDL